MKHRVLNLGAAFLSAGLVLFSQPLMAETVWPKITPGDVAASLEANKAAWAAKVEAVGRPRLLLTQEGLAAAKSRLLSNPRPTETRDLLDQAAKIVRNYPKAYEQHDGNYESAGDLWIRVVGDDMVALTVACALEPNAAWEKKLHDGIIEACKYPAWGRAGALPGPNMDLACAHMARAVALAWDWFPQLWTEEDRQLILKTIDERAGQLLVGLYGKAYWAAGYADNHNHVDCTGLAWCGLAFYNELPHAPEWLAAARLDFQNVARYYPQDGSSAEGVPYWSYGLGFILQYIEGTRSVTDSAELYKAPFLKNAASYRLNASTPGFLGTLPWGDAPLKDFYGPQHMLNRLGTELGDPSPVWVARHIPWKPQGGSDVLALNALWQSPAETSMPVLELDHHQSETEMAVTRSGWGTGDYLLAIKSGFNNRNHCHLDAGALAFAFGNDWLLTASGYGEGHGSRDFWNSGGPRWAFFSNATESHCTLLLNGQNQRFDAVARGTIDAFLSTPFWSWTGIDLTQAYQDVHSVRREILHRRGDYILVFDAVAPKAPATVEWLAQLPAEPKKEGNTLAVEGDSGQLWIDMLSPAKAFEPRQPTSLHVDKKNIHTYAVKQSGDTAQFVALLRPSFSSDTMPELKTELKQTPPGLKHLTLRGAGWTDEVFHSEADAALKTQTGVSAQAKTLAVRTEKEEVTSLLAVAASRVEMKDIVIHTDGPAQIGLQRTPDGSWVVDSDQDLAGKITAAHFAVQALENSGTPHRYLLAKGAMTSSSATAWIQSLLVFRDRARPEIPVKPLATQAPLPVSVVIPIEAEDFTLQKRGQAEVVEGKPGAMGKSVRNFGYGAPEHLISWEMNVARAGQYQLTIRYATDLSDLSLGVLIDGAAPSPELVNIALPSTGGWSIKKSDWKNLVLSDSKGQPFIFSLPQGKHHVSLINPTGAIGLDRLEFRGATGR